MNNRILKYLILLAGVTLLFSFASNSKVFAETTLSEKAISIFTSDTCEFCDELETELKKTYEASSYSLKNIDKSEANKTAYQVALVTCGKEKGTVPMFLHEGACISGKEQILEVFKTVNSANDLSKSVEAEKTKVTTVQSALDLITNEKATDALSVSDYIIAAILLILLIVAAVLFIRSRKSTNKNLKLFSAIASFVVLASFSGFLFVKVNDINNLSSTGAEAAGKAKNCLESNTCKDWNEFVNAKSENAKNEGRHEDAKEWKEKEVDQKILDQQIAAQNNALVTAIEANKNEAYCQDLKPGEKCTYATFLREVQVGKTSKEYLSALYGTFRDSDKDTKTKLGGLVAQAIADYNEIQRKKAYKGFADDICTDAELEQEKEKKADDETGGTSNCVTPTKVEEIAKKLREKCKELTSKQLEATSITNCSTANQSLLIQELGFKLIKTDEFTGLGVYVPTAELGYIPKELQDECLVPTSGGACPQGTATCVCQETPTYRATCAAIGQSCYQVCIATHNVCEKDCSRTPLTEIPPENPPSETASCQESCSSTVPCTDGTSCVGGKCINVSCPTEADCLCNSTTPICGDGVINASPQAPEQCELGNPPGTSCSWDSCDQNSCTCPDSNPNWDIEKSSAVVCVNEGTVSAYAQVKFNISATYINEDNPTEVGILERVVDRPQGYLAGWLDTASISNGGTATTSGGTVSEITWDLTGALSQFTIPSGQTQITKDNFLSYTFVVPQNYFGNYVNLVTGYPNQEDDNNSFSYTNSVFISCGGVPTTAIGDSNLVKAIIGIFLVVTGLMFAYSQRSDGILLKIVNSPAYSKFSILMSSGERKEELKKKYFESRVLKGARKEK
ncbi:hypothetical protein HYV12_02070 [Candidatus Dojkabacteria bacterium]|nr:hypothetical protein [Candidatus Dojkabacteria bacterium]